MTQFLGAESVARNASVPARASLDALLRFAWEADAFTAGDALAALGLSRSTTIEAIDDLVGLNLVQSSVTGFCPAALLFRRLGLASGSGCAFR